MLADKNISFETTTGYVKNKFFDKMYTEINLQKLKKTWEYKHIFKVLALCHNCRYIYDVKTETKTLYSRSYVGLNLVEFAANHGF